MGGDYRDPSGQESSSGNWAPPPPWAHWSNWGRANWGNPQSRASAPQQDLRIGDAERSEMIDTLSKHFAEGRLDEHEMRERVEQATAAKTRGDLSGLLYDLPPVQPQPGPAPAVMPHRRHRFLMFVLITLALISVAGWMAAPWHFPWVLVFLFAFLIFRRGGWYHHHHHGGGWNRPPNSY
jgi:hypothetical protein